MTIRARLDQLLAEPTDPAAGSGRDRAVVFCGDLNDEPEAATTQIVAGPSGSQIELVPGSEIELKPGSGFTRPDQDDGFRLWNLAPLLPEGQRFTRVFKGRGELIDQALSRPRSGCLRPHSTAPTSQIKTRDNVDPSTLVLVKPPG
jgi:hypothetical protein